MNKDNFKVSFIAVGPPKCGTTWIYKCLEEHPQICMNRPKELHFFRKNKQKEKPGGLYEYGIDYYKRHFNHCQEEQIIGELGHLYFQREDSVKLIKKTFPDVKTIVCLRNPVNKLFSHYNHGASKNVFKKSFEEMIKDREWVNRFTQDHIHLKKFLDNFPKKNILILIYEDAKKNPKKFIQTIYKFIGVDENYIPKSVNIKYNSTALRYSTKNKKVKSFLFKVYNILRKIPILKNLMKLTREKGITAKTLKTINSFTSKKEVKSPEIKKETKEKLKKITANDVTELEKLLGYKIKQWK